MKTAKWLATSLIIVASFFAACATHHPQLESSTPSPQTLPAPKKILTVPTEAGTVELTIFGEPPAGKALLRLELKSTAVVVWQQKISIGAGIFDWKGVPALWVQDNIVVMRYWTDEGGFIFANVESYELATGKFLGEEKY